MKATGIVRRVDELGRVVLPKELRRTMEIKEKDPMEIFTDGDSIVLRPYRVRCKHCGSEDELLDAGRNIVICKSCALVVTDMVMEKGL